MPVFAALRRTPLDDSLLASLRQLLDGRLSTSAAVKALKGYQPSAVGALTYQGGGVRPAYIEA